MIRFGEGRISEQPPLFGHTIGVELGRAFQFGPSIGQSQGLPDGPQPFASAREEAERRWTPFPVILRADVGGIAGIGPFLGAEYLVTDHLAIGLLARLSIWMDYGTGVTAHMPHVLFPGIAGRYYFTSQSGAEAPRGFYLGGTVEYHDYARGAGDLSTRAETDENGWTGYYRVEGSLVFPMAEAGYRLPLWRSSFLELGLQLGWALGEGRTEDEVTLAPDGTVNNVEASADGELSPGPRISPVFVLGTRLY